MVHSSGLPSFVRLLSFAVLFLLSALSTWQTALAAGPGIPVSWLTATNGNWTDATKWSNSVYPNNGSPTPTDTYEVTLNSLGAAHTVTLQNNVAVNSLTLDSPNVTFLHSNGILTTDLITLNQGVYQFGSDSLGFPSGHEIVGATIVGNGGEFRIGRRNHSVHVLRDVTLDIDLTLPSPTSTPAQPLLTIEEGLTIATGRSLDIDRRDSLMLVKGTQTVDGSGEIVFTDTSIAGTATSGSIILSDGTTLTLGPSITVRAESGRGAIGHRLGELETNANVKIVNQGLMSANTAGRTLEIFNVYPTETATFVNEGVVEAVGTGRTMVGGAWTNLGTFRIRDSGILQLAGSYKLSELGTIDRQGGQLRLTGRMDNIGNVFTSNATTGSIVIGQSAFIPTQVLGGTIDAIDGTTYNLETSELHDVTWAAQGIINGSRRIDIYDNLTLQDGKIGFSLLSSSGEIWFRENASQRLQGNGSIDFVQGNDSKITIQKELTITSDVVVQSLAGRGIIKDGKLISQGTLKSAAGSTLNVSVADLLNQGTIEVSGTTIIGRDRAATWHNDGEIRVKAGAQLHLNGTFKVSDIGTLVNEGGQIRLTGTLDNTGQTLDLQSLNLGVPLTVAGHIRGGTITSSGSADLEFISGGLNVGRLIGVTLAKNLYIPRTASRVEIENGITIDNKVITMQEGAELSFVEAGPQTLQGTATIFVEARSDANTTASVSGERLVIGENITIRNGTQAANDMALEFLENRGTVISEAPTSIVSIGASTSSGSWKNLGTIRALAGTVQFGGVYKTSAIGTVEVAGGAVKLTGTIDNVGQTIVQNAQTGSWRIDGFFTGGRIESTNALPILSGRITDLTIAGPASIGDGLFTTESNLLTRLTLDNGELTIARRASFGVSADVPIEGHGTIYLAGTISEPGILQIYTGGKLTIGSGITVRTSPQGGGLIGRGSLPLLNYGTISAQNAAMQIIVGGAFQNFGFLEAKNASFLHIDTASWVNQGTIQANVNGVFRINGTQFENGSDGRIVGHGTITLPTATLINKGTIAPGNSIGTLTVSGKVELTPTSIVQIELGKDGAKDLLSATGNVTLGGTLEVLKGEDFNAQLGRQYEILRSTLGQITGTFSNPDGLVQVGFVQFAIGYTSKSVILTTTAIPEPSGFVLLFALAIVLLGSLKMRGRHRVIIFS